MSGCRLFLSGVETTSYYDKVTHAGTKTVLMSYYYIKRRGIDLPRKRKEANPEIQILVDSGAHTMQGGAASLNTSQYQAYAEEYADWIERNRDIISGCVELDCESIVGLDQVYQWERDLFIPLEQSGVPVIFVWHPERGIEDFKRMCRDHRWVGIAQDVYKAEHADVNTYRTIARQNLTHLHGFGITRIDWITKNWFATCDSTTWKAGEMYGVAYVWDGTDMHALVMKDKARRAQYKTYYEAAGVDPQKIMDGDSRELTKLNTLSWAKMGEFLRQRFANQTFHWDLRPPVPAAIDDLSDAELKVWAQNLRMYDADTDIAVFSREEQVIYVSLMSSLLNWQVDDVRANAQSLNDILRGRVEDIGLPLTSVSPEPLIESYRKKVIGYVMQNMTKHLSAEMREPHQYTPVAYTPRKIDDDWDQETDYGCPAGLLE